MAANIETKQQAKGRERRRFSRVNSGLATLAVCQGKDAHILDISSNGVQLEFACDAPRGAVTQVTLPQLAQNLACETMWRRGNRLGLRFTEKPYEISARLPVGLRIRLLNG